MFSAYTLESDGEDLFVSLYWLEEDLTNYSISPFNDVKVLSTINFEWKLEKFCKMKKKKKQFSIFFEMIYFFFHLSYFTNAMDIIYLQQTNKKGFTLPLASKQAVMAVCPATGRVVTSTGIDLNLWSTCKGVLEHVLTLELDPIFTPCLHLSIYHDIIAVASSSDVCLMQMVIERVTNTQSREKNVNESNSIGVVWTNETQVEDISDDEDLSQVVFGANRKTLLPRTTLTIPMQNPENVANYFDERNYNHAWFSQNKLCDVVGEFIDYSAPLLMNKSEGYHLKGTSRKVFLHKRLFASESILALRIIPQEPHLPPSCKNEHFGDASMSTSVYCFIVITQRRAYMYSLKLNPVKPSKIIRRGVVHFSEPCLACDIQGSFLYALNEKSVDVWAIWTARATSCYPLTSITQLLRSKNAMNQTTDYDNQNTDTIWKDYKGWEPWLLSSTPLSDSINLVVIAKKTKSHCCIVALRENVAIFLFDRTQPLQQASRRHKLTSRRQSFGNIPESTVSEDDSSAEFKENVCHEVAPVQSQPTSLSISWTGDAIVRSGNDAVEWKDVVDVAMMEGCPPRIEVEVNVGFDIGRIEPSNEPLQTTHIAQHASLASLLLFPTITFSTVTKKLVSDVRDLINQFTTHGDLSFQTKRHKETNDSSTSFNKDIQPESSDIKKVHQYIGQLVHWMSILRAKSWALNRTLYLNNKEFTSMPEQYEVDYSSDELSTIEETGFDWQAGVTSSAIALSVVSKCIVLEMQSIQHAHILCAGILADLLLHKARNSQTNIVLWRATAEAFVLSGRSPRECIISLVPLYAESLEIGEEMRIESRESLNAASRYILLLLFGEGVEDPSACLRAAYVEPRSKSALDEAVSKLW